MLHLVPAARLSVAALIAELPAAEAFHVNILRLDQLPADQRIKPFNTVFHLIPLFFSASRAVSSKRTRCIELPYRTYRPDHRRTRTTDQRRPPCRSRAGAEHVLAVQLHLNLDLIGLFLHIKHNHSPFILCPQMWGEHSCSTTHYRIRSVLDETISPFYKTRTRTRPPAGADLPPMQVFVPSVGKLHQATFCGLPQ